MYHFFQSQYNHLSLTGTVGGNISSTGLSGYLGELFYHNAAPPTGTNLTTYQYRKVFIKNGYSTESTETKVWVDALEHDGQISIANSYNLTDSSNADTEPTNVTGWVETSNYVDGLDIGTLVSNGYTGLWIRQELNGITSPDPYATFRLYVGGLISD